MDLGLKDKGVIVTGAGSNIGRAIALTFAKEGAKITVVDIDEAQGNKVADACRAAGAADVLFCKTDVTNFDQVQKMVNDTVGKFGSLDALVNAVGWDNLMFFVDTTPEFWQKIIQLNYIAVLNCTKAALDVMIKQNQGSIVSISSDASRQGEPREAVYGGIKAAVNAFMKTIAKENGRFGIRCNVVCPGVTIPEQDEEVGSNSMWSNREAMFTDDQLIKVAKAMPLKKVGRPQDIANSVVFLSSKERSGHITGQVLSVSGGYSMVG